MAYDPVLERDMFRPKSRGVVALSDSEDNEDLKSRREQALAMIEAAKQKFDPENYQTLSEQERPQVFRPVAVNMPSQQQTANTAQRMQQMAAQGVRPVGMARGGHVYHFASGGMKPTINPSGYTENLTSGEQDTLAGERADEAAMGLRTLGAGVEPTDLLTDEEIDNWYGKQVGQSNLSASELNDRALRAKDKYYTDRALQIFKENYPKGYLDVSDPSKVTEASTEFGRIGAADVAADNARKAETKAKIIADIKDKLIREDIGGDSFTNAYNLFKKESSSERAARQERQARETANLEKYGTANPAPGFKDSLSDNITDRRQWLYDPVTDVDGRETTYGDIKIKYSPYLAEGRQARAEGVLAAGRAAYGDEAPLISDIEKSKYDQGIASLADMEKGVAAGRDAYGAEAPLAVDQEAKPIIGQMGRAGAAGQGISSIRSGEEKAAAPATGGTPATGGAQPSQGGAQPSQGGLGSFKQQGESVDSGPMTLEGIRAERAREREENMNLALIQAGLAIMGGKSSNALANIGEGAQAGVRQFAASEGESKKLMRESTRDLLEQQRAAAALAESRRQFGITSANEATRLGLEGRRLTEAERAAKANEALAAELGRGRLALDVSDSEKKWKASDAKANLDATIAANDDAYKRGVLTNQQRITANTEAETASQIKFREEQIRLDERKLKQLPTEISNAAYLGGWRPDDKGTPPTDAQILSGLDRLTEKDQASSLEKIINSPYADQELKDKATARLSAILDRQGQKPSTTGSKIIGVK